ncbi:MAG: hypothetical protein JXX14_01125 [Deltaproteobacteria bacterium]|nr:hypothetical protein [Deltaproteobacteria bacterium]
MVRQLTTLASIMLFPLAAVANDGMAPSVFEMIQEDQNVKIVLQMADSGEPGTSDTFKLTRNSGDESVTVFADKTFSVGDAVFAGDPECRWSDLDMEPSEFCLRKTCEGCEDAEFFRTVCNDCDGDGTLDCWGDCLENSETGEMECQETYCEKEWCNADCDNDGVDDCDGWCQTVYRFEITDACVAPGEYQYEFYTRNTASGEWDDLSWIDVPLMAVNEVDAACGDATEDTDDTDIGDDAESGDGSAQSDDDAENDDDAAAEDDSASGDAACSIIVPGRSPVSRPFSLPFSLYALIL